MNFEDFKKLTAAGVGLAVASRDEKRNPSLDDLLGLKLNSDGKSLLCFLNAEDSWKALDNFRSCSQIAISLSRPCDYFAAQIKGQVTQIRKMSPEEELISQRWADLYLQELVLINVAPETIANLSFKADTTLEVVIEDLFIQTPGTQAGCRLEKV